MHYVFKESYGELIFKQFAKGTPVYFTSLWMERIVFPFYDVSRYVNELGRGNPSGHIVWKGNALPLHENG